MWQMVVANTAVGAVTGYLQGSANKATTAANNRISAANERAGNKIRQAENAFSAARTSLAAYTQSVNNNRLLDSGASAYEAEAVNARRQDDAMLNSSLDEQISMAEQAGAASAVAALNGVAGTVVNDVQMSIGIRQSRATRDADMVRGMASWDHTRRASSIAQQMFQSLDQSLILPSLDYNTNVAMINNPGSPSRTAILSALQSGWESFKMMGGGGGGDPGKPGQPNGKSDSVSFGSPRLGDRGAGGWYGSEAPRFGSSSGSSIRLGG